MIFLFPKVGYVFSVEDTLPETNVAPENRPLEKEIPIGTTIFRGYVSFREGILFFQRSKAVVMQTCCCSRFFLEWRSLLCSS